MKTMKWSMFMPKELFTEAQTTAARELADKLYSEWSAERDGGARLLAVSFFLATAVATTVPTKANAEKLIDTIARQAAANLSDIPGWPESFHGRPS